jgi:hypothetical protein
VGQTVLDALAIAFWPFVVGAAAAGWLLRADQGSLAVAWSAAALAGIAGILSVTIFDVTSLWILLDMFVGMILFGAVCLLVVYWRWSALPRGSRILLIVMGVAGLGAGGEQLVGDYLVPRRVVQGTIENLFISWQAFGPDAYHVRIDGVLYLATVPLYRTLRVGDRVEAEIGRSSGYIYRLHRQVGGG